MVVAIILINNGDKKLKCELCNQEHDGSYGSGRFCCAKCARSFSTKNKRKEINQKVSNTIKNKHKGTTNKEIKNKQKIEKINYLLNNGYTYIKYPNIDFGTNYLINTDGIIFSTFVMRELSHTAYNNNDTYKRMVLTDINKNRHVLYIHRIVAQTFIPNPNNYAYINHKDENPSNNCVDNLEWCSCSYNNTYNNIHLKKGKKISESIKKKGGPHNKGKKNVVTQETKDKISKSSKGHKFRGNQYVKIK